MRHDPIDPGRAEERDARAVTEPSPPEAHLPFANRAEAGRALAAKLVGLVATPSVVVGIPRGGVAVALPIAERLGAPLTVVYARKLTAPFAPELAFGALDEDGHVFTDPEIVALLGLRADDIERAKGQVAAEIRRRMALYGAPPLSRHLPGAGVVLVDDGLATGLTMRAAVAYARRHDARDVTVAVPCASSQAAARFRHEADRFVSLVVDPAFMAVGAYYLDFSPVGDGEVRAMLGRARPADPPDARPSDLRISFKNARGLRLAGELLLPSTAGPHPVVVFAHGRGSGKASPCDRAIAEGLRQDGTAAFLFDFSGHGESEGTEAESTPGQQTNDLLAALALLDTLDDLDSARVGIAGAGSGAAVALRVAAHSARVRALALRSASPEGAERVAAAVTAPTLLIVGEHDPLVAATAELAGRLGGPHRLEVVPGGDGLFEDPDARRRAVALTAGWFRQHLG